MEDLRVNEEAVEVVEEVVMNGKLTKGLKVCAGVAVVSGVGFVTYKYAVKPLVAKIKDKREAKKASKPELHVINTEYSEDGIQE